MRGSFRKFPKLQENERLIDNPIFKSFKMPTIRVRDRLPILLDFSSGCAAVDGVPPKVLNEQIANASRIVDGLILSQDSLLSLNVACSLEIWGRVNQTSITSTPNSQRKDANPMYQCILDLLQNGASGLVGSLLLGRSASEEADNIQELATIRSLSLELGLPFVIDVQLENISNNLFLEVIEMGVNLATELGCEAIMIPGGQYLSADNHVEIITDLPILIRQSISQKGEEPVLPFQYGCQVHVNGVILADIGPLDRLDKTKAILERWVRSLQVQLGGE